MEKTGLVKFDAAMRAIAQAKSIDEVKDIRDKAEACRKYAKQAGESLKGQNMLAEIKIRAERRAGQMLKDMENVKPGRPKKGNTMLPLSEIGITKIQSSRWQLEAELPEDELTNHVKAVNKRGMELTSSSIQKLAKAKIRIERRAAMAGRPTTKSRRWEAEEGDIRTYKTAKRFDFIITDPPYLKEYLPLYDVLAFRAKEWLQDGGLLITMCGQSYLDRIYSMMGEHLQYYWTGCYLTPGQPTPLRARQVNTTWKPLLFFVKRGDKYTGKIFGDVFKSEGNDKSLHEWGQSESGMFSIVGSICLPGQAIFDPFMGAATTGIAALRHGCTFHGIDIDKENVRLSKARLSNDTKKK
jgi:16S rRNA G966 N2-methylase RsmD